MPGVAGHRSPGRRHRHRRRNGQGARTLLRRSHIFASAVRDILELKLLREVSSGPLSLTQFHLLKLMSLDGSHQIHQVAEYLGVSPPAATKNVDKLEKLGLVVRAPFEGDRRATRLSVSPSGRRLVREYERLREKLLSPVLRRFDAAEIEQLSGLLGRFSVALLELEQSRHEFCLRCAAYLERDCPVSVMRGGCPYRDLGSHP